VSYGYSETSSDNPSIYLLDGITDDNTSCDWSFTPVGIPLMIQGILSGNSVGFV
jgi:hypothetical protein